ncbi:MAG: hypothetical protein R3Y67_03245 [Eubacteriales bacterium]
MKVKKEVIAQLEKCYSIAPLHYNGIEHLLVAAEKTDKCILFDYDGKYVDTVWEEPGGAMSMVQVPDSNGQFLSTHQFYSPNDSKNAKIVIVTPIRMGEWEVRTLVDLPHVHRFDILRSEATNYLIACTLKSGHEYKDDWTSHGKVYVAQLPNDLSEFHEDNQLALTVIQENLLKNHGYYQVLEGNQETSVISSETGVHQVVPPTTLDGKWMIKELIKEPTSDAVLMDLDGDGQKELITIAPFHGSRIVIYKNKDGTFVKEYEYEQELEFLHAIYAVRFGSRNAVVIGHREGKRNLMVFTYNKEQNQYEAEIIDSGCGPANVFCYCHKGQDKMIATNREINEVAMYTIEC